MKKSTDASDRTTPDSRPPQAASPTGLVQFNLIQRMLKVQKRAVNNPLSEMFFKSFTGSFKALLNCNSYTPILKSVAVD